MSKLIKIFLMIIFALAISCSNEGTTGGGVVYTPLGYTHSNHPPEGNYSYNGSTNTNATIHTVRHNGDACIITGKVSSYNDSRDPVLDYEITVTSWYTATDGKDNFAVTNLTDPTNAYGVITFTKPDGFYRYLVSYNTTDKTISVDLRTNSKTYYASRLKKVGE